MSGEKRGKLIVLDGIDGSGKSTQFELLRDRLEREGVPFRYLRFPRYSERSSLFVREYLAGELGAADEVSPYVASAFYAHDRMAAFREDLRAWLESGGLLLCDRYTTANAILQGAKLSGTERFRYIDWLFDYEYERLGLPAPDLVLLLNMPAETAVRLIERRGEGQDIHEQLDFLSRAEACGLAAAERYGWRVVDCMRGGVLRDREEIAAEIYGAVRTL